MKMVITLYQISYEYQAEIRDWADKYDYPYYTNTTNMGTKTLYFLRRKHAIKIAKKLGLDPGVIGVINSNYYSVSME